MEYNSGNDCGAWTKEVGLHRGKKNDGLWCVQAICTAVLARSSSLTSLAV